MNYPWYIILTTIVLVSFPFVITAVLIIFKLFKTTFRYSIIAIAWILYLLLIAYITDYNKSITPTYKIKSLFFSSTDDVTLNVGECDFTGILKVIPNLQENYSLYDISFISQNSDIATISCLNNEPSQTVHYVIEAKKAGETNVYVRAKEGNVQTYKIHVVVIDSTPILIENITLSDYKTNLSLGEMTKANVTISPSNTYDTYLAWSTSDANVASVDENGNVTAVGSGTVTITATSTNNISASYTINIDGTVKKAMSLYVHTTKQNDINIGSEWTYTYLLNGEQTTRSIEIYSGEVLELYTELTESDDIPDVGSASMSYTVTEDDVKNGFELSMDVYVTENGGKNRGKTVYYIVTYRFTPEVE